MRAECALKNLGGLGVLGDLGVEYFISRLLDIAE
jgi:hypothetical protein